MNRDHQPRRRNGQFDFNKPAVSAQGAQGAQAAVAKQRAVLNAADSAFQDALATVALATPKRLVDYEGLNDAYGRLQQAAADHDHTAEQFSGGFVIDTGASAASTAKHAANEAILRRITADYDGKVTEVVHYHDDPDYDPPARGHLMSDFTISVRTPEGYDREVLVRLEGDPLFEGPITGVDRKAGFDEPGFVLLTSPAQETNTLLDSEGRQSIEFWLNNECEELDLDRGYERGDDPYAESLGY